MSYGNGVLPEASTLGSINPHTLSLELECASAGSLSASIAGGGDNIPAQVLSHELCHWSDIIGTIWGQSYLDTLFNALDQATTTASDDVVSVYRQALSLFDVDRAIMFPIYYKVFNPAAKSTNDRHPWASDVSCGAWIDQLGNLDDSRPIFFVRFHDDESGMQVARQPLNIGSLFELRALASENLTFLDWLQHQPDDSQLVSKIQFRRKRLSFFYDPEFTTYTAAGHLLSNCSGERDVLEVCDSGAMIAHLCLNASSKAFGRLKAPAEFKKGFTQPRLGGFRRGCDRGYLFACLAYHLREAKEAGHSPDLDEMVRKAGLTSIKNLNNEAEQWFKARLFRPLPLKNPDLNRVRARLTEFGLVHLSAALTKFGRPLTAGEYLQHDLPSPSMMTNDCIQSNFTSQGLSDADSDILNAANSVLADVTRMGLRSGRGLDFGFGDYVY